jgi:hypothetical protein
LPETGGHPGRFHHPIADKPDVTADRNANRISDMGEHVQFEIGDRMLEVDGGLLGCIASEGVYPGEWIVTTAAGTKVACLAENLRLIQSEHDNSGQQEA